MADGVLGGILGDEDEKSEAEALEPVAGAEAFAAAVAAIASRQDPGVARMTEEFLSDQSQLLKVQKKHLEEQQAARLHLLRGQASEVDIRRFGLRLRIGFQLFIALVATMIGIGILLVVRDAVSANGVVIEAFSVPPDLAQRGLTGQVIAKQVLDQLSDVQAKNDLLSARSANSYTSSWGKDLRVEVPATGVSFGELNRYLHETLGHETRISGEVYATYGGLTVTARTGDEAGKSFTGRTEELDQLVRKAAEAAYQQTQPYRFANFLWFHGRRDEAMPILERLARDPNPVERSWAHLLIGVDAFFENDDLERYAAEQRAALADAPGHFRAIEHLMIAEARLGHDAAVIDLAKQCLAAGPAGKATISPSYHKSISATCLTVKGIEEGDYPEAVRTLSSLSEQDRTKGLIIVLGRLLSAPLLAHDTDFALAYDWSGLLEAYAGTSWPDRFIAELRETSLASVALELGDARAVQLWSEVSAKEADPARLKAHDYMLRASGPWLALAKAQFGDLPGALALINQTPKDCRMCVDFRGRVSAIAGNAEEAERWFSEAIKLAPELPQVYVDRGEARLNRGDAAGALTDASRAATLSPHDGDAWKLWGDVLAKQGDAKGALQRYDAALKYAPNWKRLKDARAAVVKPKT